MPKDADRESCRDAGRPDRPAKRVPACDDRMGISRLFTLPMYRFAPLALWVILLASCSSMHPEGQLKNVMEGKFFEPPDRTAEKAKEDADRSREQQVPPLQDSGDVKFRIPL